MGTESARRQLEQHTTELVAAQETIAESAMTVPHPSASRGLGQQGQQISGRVEGDSTHDRDVMGAARLAELSARCAALEQQLEAERAQAATR